MELHNESSSRLTYELDVAITVNDWEQWIKVEDDIINLESFKKDPNQKQRFLYCGNFPLDIVTFGAILKGDYKIFCHKRM